MRLRQTVYSVGQTAKKPGQSETVEWKLSNKNGRSDFFVGMEAHSRKLGKKLVVPAKAGGRPA